MKILIIAPSFKRPHKSSTQKMYPFIPLLVMESEVDEYKKNGNDIIACPDSAQGNLCRIKNYILDTYSEGYDAILIIDDDYKKLGRWEGLDYVGISPDDLKEFVQVHTILCKEWGFHFWGLNCIWDKKAYREFSPFSTNNYIGGPFHCHLTSSELRYDEALSLKDDYDMTLQHMHKYGGALRVNYASYIVKQAENEGGIATDRNLDREKAAFWILQKKWGKDVVKRDKKSLRTFDFNPILKIPIRGS